MQERKRGVGLVNLSWLQYVLTTPSRASMTSSSTCPVSEELKSLVSRVRNIHIILLLAALKRIPQFSIKFKYFLQCNFVLFIF